MVNAKDEKFGLGAMPGIILRYDFSIPSRIIKSWIDSGLGRVMVGVMPETIEAEVVEINGRKPPERAESGPAAGMKAFTLQLDRRWWPLWVLLALVGVVLVMTVGVFFGVIYLAFAVVRGLLRLVFGLLSPSGASSMTR